MTNRNRFVQGICIILIGSFIADISIHISTHIIYSGVESHKGIHMSSQVIRARTNTYKDIFEAICITKACLGSHKYIKVSTGVFIS